MLSMDIKPPAKNALEAHQWWLNNLRTQAIIQWGKRITIK